MRSIASRTHKTRVGSDLIVAAATGVQFATGIAKLVDQGLFDIHVNIFELCFQFKASFVELRFDLAEGGHDLLAFVGADDFLIGKHLRVGDAAGNVLRVETLVEADAFGEAFNAAINRGIKSTATARACLGSVLG